MQKFRDQLAEQQEIVAALANIVMDVYAMESSLRRAQKSGAARAQAAGGVADAAQAFISDAMDRIEKEARTAFAAVAEGDALLHNWPSCADSLKHAPIDTIALRRRWRTPCWLRIGIRSRAVERQEVREPDRGTPAPLWRQGQHTLVPCLLLD